MLSYINCALVSVLSFAASAQQTILESTADVAYSKADNLASAMEFDIRGEDVLDIAGMPRDKVSNIAHRPIGKTRYMEGSPIQKYRDIFQALEIPDYVIGEEQRNFLIDNDNIIFHHLKDGTKNRQVYSLEPLREEEVALIEGLKAWASERNLPLPEWAFDEHAYALRFLSSYRSNYQKSYEMLLEHEQWLIHEAPKLLEQEEKWQSILRSGIYYGMGRDKYQRPVLYLDFKKFCKSNLSDDDLISFSSYFNSYVINNAMVPGRADQWVLIFDLKDVGFTDVPLGMIGKYAKYGTLHFKQRNGATVYLNMHWLISAAVNLFKGFLDEGQMKCNFFFTTDYHSFIDEMIGLENVQAKYGGRLPNNAEGTSEFPPRFNL